jgi:drug/metabolite transporter (DMT)-like permease
MWLLVWAVIGNSLFIQIFKKVERSLALTARVYVPYGLLATAIALAYAAGTGSASPQTGALSAGLVFGLALYASLWFYFKALTGARSGMVWTIQALNILVPIGAALWLWQEKCTILQIIGLLCVLLGAAGVAWGRKSGAAPARDTVSGIVFAVLGSICSGIVGVCWKYLGVAGLNNQTGWFILVAYAVVLLANALASIRLGWPRPAEWLWGGLLGTAHVAGTILSVQAVLAVAAPVAFPVLVGGPLVLTLAAGRLVWRERFSRVELADIGFCLAGIVCLTLK